MDFALTADHRVKLKESEKEDKYLGLVWELKKTVEHKSDYDTNCYWCSCTVTKGLVKRLEDLEMETIKTTALLRSAIILKRDLEI